MANETQTSTHSPSYCPTCQRLFRTAPNFYICPFDQTPVIDVSDPLPSRRSFGFSMASVGVTLLIVLGVTVPLVQ